MSARTITSPWRKVTLIEERPGRTPASGGAWILTLSCGHRTRRRRMARSFENTVGVIMGRIPLMAGCAPKKVRCYGCWATRVQGRKAKT